MWTAFPMALPVKAAMAAAADKRGRTAVAAVLAAVFLPFALAVVLVMGLLDGTSAHNVSAVDLSFHGGTISGQAPEEYKGYIEDIRGSFAALDGLIAGVENLEDGEIDAGRVKSYFYALYFGDDQPSRRAQKAFLECFLRYEERTREVEREDGTIVEEPYTAAIFLTDQDEICGNLESLFGTPLTVENRTNALRIYAMAMDGQGEEGQWGGMESGEAIGEGSRGALFSEAEKYIGYPYVWGGSSPSTSFDCSGYICWIFTHSGVYNLPRTTAQGIYGQCAAVSREEARPGDLVFFTGTYASSTPVTHVGLYVGDGKMLHAGDPIGYADLNANYWRVHYYATGRLPGIP